MCGLSVVNVDSDLLTVLRSSSLRAAGSATVQDVMGELGLAQGTAYSYVNRLDDAGVVTVVHDEQPRRYAAREIDLTVTAADGERAYTITPALIDAVGRRPR